MTECQSLECVPSATARALTVQWRWSNPAKRAPEYTGSGGSTSYVTFATWGVSGNRMPWKQRCSDAYTATLDGSSGVS